MVLAVAERPGNGGGRPSARTHAKNVGLAVAIEVAGHHLNTRGGHPLREVVHAVVRDMVRPVAIAEGGRDCGPPAHPSAGHIALTIAVEVARYDLGTSGCAPACEMGNAIVAHGEGVAVLHSRRSRETVVGELLDVRMSRRIPWVSGIHPHTTLGSELAAVVAITAYMSAVVPYVEVIATKLHLHVGVAAEWKLLAWIATVVAAARAPLADVQTRRVTEEP